MQLLADMENPQTIAQLRISIPSTTLPQLQEQASIAQLIYLELIGVVEILMSDLTILKFLK